MPPRRYADRNILLWLPRDEIEPQAFDQIQNVAALPFIHKHVAIMPDCHMGHGATIGTAFATRDAVVPSAVGVDIGCGMIAVRTPVTRGDLPEDLSPVRRQIERLVPMGKGGNHESSPGGEVAQAHIAELETRARDRGKLDFFDGLTDWRQQIGTLGGGNHFIEIVLDEEDRVWAFLHSGSRGVGLKISQHHQKIAKRITRDIFWEQKLADPELSFIPRKLNRRSLPEFTDYVEDMRWAQRLAACNREAMMDRVLASMRRYIGEFPVNELEQVQCHHNFAEWEHHDGHDLLVVRKGAIAAHEGRLGLIPGSMGTKSYVVRGLGNEASFCTAPHGAGRRMSRTRARAELSEDEFRKQMSGVEWSGNADRLLDEAPDAYKDIDRVIEQSRDLVEVVHELRPILNCKGLK